MNSAQGWPRRLDCLSGVSVARGGGCEERNGWDKMLLELVRGHSDLESHGASRVVFPSHRAPSQLRLLRRAGNAGGRADFVHLGGQKRLSFSTTPATYSLPNIEATTSCKFPPSPLSLMSTSYDPWSWRMKRVLSHVWRYQPPARSLCDLATTSSTFFYGGRTWDHQKKMPHVVQTRLQPNTR